MATKKAKKADVVQAKNPRSGRYVRIDRSAGKVIGHKKTEGPYNGVPVAHPQGEPPTTTKSRPLPYRAKVSPAVKAYIAEAEEKYGKPRLSLDEGREIIDMAMGDKLLSDVVIQGRH